eukprot:m.326180 g.326180  ORF g.326180 m.326180 type:complete len:538 (-) comp20398_c1_seq3:189-1802(-)
MDKNETERDSRSKFRPNDSRRPKRTRLRAAKTPNQPVVVNNASEASGYASVSTDHCARRITRNAKKARKDSQASTQSGVDVPEIEAHDHNPVTTQRQEIKRRRKNDSNLPDSPATCSTDQHFRSINRDGGTNTHTATAGYTAASVSSNAASDTSETTEKEALGPDGMREATSHVGSQKNHEHEHHRKGDTACGRRTVGTESASYTGSDTAGDSSNGSDSEEPMGYGGSMPSTLSDIRTKYTRTEKIGAGTYGVVYKAYITQGQEAGKFVALKKIRLEDDDNGVPSAALWEITSLKRANHTNVVSLLDMGLHGNWLYLVFEYVERDLRSYLDACAGTGTGLDYGVVKHNMWQLLQGIHHCHCQQILHRDLKPGNILIDRHGTLKIADFGMARPLTNRTQSYSPGVVTLWYRPPEILLNILHYTTSVDMWSIGCIFIEMATGVPAFAGDAEIDQLYRIFKELGTPSEQDWPGITRLPMYIETFPPWQAPPLRRTLLARTEVCIDGEDLIRNLLMMCPQHRLSASEALLHPLFRDKSRRH